MDHKNNTIIESLGVYLPPESCTTNEVLKACKNDFHFPLENITGIKSRRMAGKSEYSIDLARKAIEDCLLNSRYRPEDIDVLICCNISRYDGANRISFEPSTSIKLNKHFGFGNALVFDITNACAGMFTGIYLVDALIKSGAVKRGMVVSGEYITHLTQSAQKELESFMDSRMACLTLGDAGAALILEEAANSNIGFQKLELQTLGRFSPFCIAKASDQGGMIMLTDSVNLTDVGIKSGAKHSIDTLKQAGWQADGFQHLIMHQTSRMTLNGARREINDLLKRNVCNDNNTINNLENRGNTASTTHFIALSDQIKENKIHSGDKLVFSISASGLTIGTALYTLDDLPDRIHQKEIKKSQKGKIDTPQSRKQPTISKISRVRIESLGTVLNEIDTENDSMAFSKGAARSCLDKSSYLTNDIGLLIYCGVYRNEYLLEPAYAALLAGELDMNATPSDSDEKKTLAFDIFNGSLGLLNACFVAQEMIMAKKCKTAMLVAAETENNRDLEAGELLGLRETGSAIILDSSSSDNEGFSCFQFQEYTEALEAYTTYCDTKERMPYLQILKDPNLEQLYIHYIQIAVKNLVKTEEIDLNQIDVIIPPQISTTFINRLSKSLKLLQEKFVNAVDGGPDIFSSSIVFSLDYALKNGLAKQGDTALVIAVSSGIQVGCAIYHF